MPDDKTTVAAADEKLVLDYRSGNSAAFDELYARYGKLVKFYSRNLFLLGAENEDLLQEGMFGLIKAVNGYREDSGVKFITYAQACIKSSLINAVKKYSSGKSSPLNNSVSPEILDKTGLFAQTPEDIVLSTERDTELRRRIYDALSKNEIIILNMYLEGLSYSEIAAAINKNIKSVDNALSRARKKIIKLTVE